MCLSLKDEDEKLSLEDNIFLEEDYEAGYEAGEDEERDAEEEEDEEGEEGEEEEEEEKESTKRKILRLVAEVASKGKEIIGNLITTAGQVVVTILLGVTGEPIFQDLLLAFQPPPPTTTVCLCRHHAALPDLRRLLLRLPLPVHLVVVLPDLRHAHLQLHVCLDGHLQRRTPHCPLPLSVPVLPRVHPTQR